MNGFFITGTDTGVGKTMVTACLTTLFKNKNVGVMKPIETGVDPQCSSTANSDAKFLMEVSGGTDSEEEVCPYRLKTPASPYQAACIAGTEIDPATILEKFKILQSRHNLMLVEGIGGLMVPITSRYNVADMALQMALPLIIVSRIQLGALNHTLLTINAAHQHGLKIKGVILNRLSGDDLDEVEQEQGKLIEKFSGTPILGTCPFIEDVSATNIEQNLTKIEQAFLESFK